MTNKCEIIIGVLEVYWWVSNLTVYSGVLLDGINVKSLSVYWLFDGILVYYFYDISNKKIKWCTTRGVRGWLLMYISLLKKNYQKSNLSMLSLPLVNWYINTKYTFPKIKKFQRDQHHLLVRYPGPDW